MADIRVNRGIISAENCRLPFWKRTLDVCLCTIALAVLLPLMAMVAVIIKINSRGPVLFRQERIGLCGSSFVIYKFRTMKLGAETNLHEAYTSELMQTNKPMAKLDAHDDRLIPFGQALRAAGLDELPQLINVLRGEMSLVGPRPCLPSEYSRYSSLQKERFETPPGITGLWQVSGKNRRTFTEMVELDILYRRQQSVWLDLKIILKTIPAVMDQLADFRSSARGDRTDGQA